MTFEGGFHGRTLATIAAGGRPKYLEGFGPRQRGFDIVPFGDLDALATACNAETAAFCSEPIQGKAVFAAWARMISGAFARSATAKAFS